MTSSTSQFRLDRARLRGFGLPSSGSAESVRLRLRLLDELRRQYGADAAPLLRLERSDARPLLEAMGARVPKYESGANMRAELVRLATGPERLVLPSSRPKNAARLDVVWRNPATLQDEVYESGLTLAEAARVKRHVEEYLRSIEPAVAAWLPTDPRATTAYAVKAPHPYPARDTSVLATAARQALDAIVSAVDLYQMSAGDGRNQERYRQMHAENRRSVELLEDLRGRLRPKSNPPTRRR